EGAVLTWSVRRLAHQDPAPLLLVLPEAAGLLPGKPCERRAGAYHILLPGDSGSIDFRAVPEAALAVSRNAGAMDPREREMR
ncbi:MAG TPA: hypothetical protein VK465_14670, partial [Fibrobacteria bacterium]|nr:hypothetical protein [Fibrobacteria bacterium]